MNFDDVFVNIQYNRRRFFSLLVRLTLIFAQKQQIKKYISIIHYYGVFFFHEF